MMMRETAPARVDTEDQRQRQLINATIETLADVGFSACTLGEIARRAGASPGLVAHYFGDKDGLLEATLRYMVTRLGHSAARRLSSIRDPRARVQAVIDATLSPEEFERRTASVWLAFWGQVIHSARFRRLQTIYQRRMLSNLRHALRQILPSRDAEDLATQVASVIDGLWLRATLSGKSETESANARQLATAFVDRQLSAMGARLPASVGRPAKATAPSAMACKARAGEESGPKHITSVNPATGEVLAELPVSSEADVDRAVTIAKAAQATWAAMTGAERARILRRTADILRARNEELAQLESRDTGKPIQETISVDVLSGADCFEYFASVAATLSGEHIDLGPSAFGYTRREPLGVVAGIGAWNYPLQIACWKSAPALACGNAMIFKPAELTPLTARHLETILREAGAPEGLFTVVQGYAETGRMLTRHPGIAKVSLTGEAGTGRKVMADAAATLKHVTLELGGKSPLIVFEDADLDDAVSGALLGNFYSAGEVCSNGTRVFVHAKAKTAFLDKLVARTRRMKIGPPLDPATQVGSLISEAHMEKVLGYIETARREGATLLTGGERVTTGGLDRGFFVAPTIFDRCTDDMTIAREEVFGPVMSVLSFRDEEEVIRRANATDYGLAAGVFTRDLARAHRVIARLEAGTCWINQYNVTPIELPFGGYKLSGLGRENSKAAVEHYTQIKSVYVNLGRIEAPY
jgi:betaine-aldehyde dehydrogenase